MKNFFPTLFLTTSCLFFLFSSLSYGGKRKEKIDPEGQSFASNAQRTMKGLSALQETAAQEEEKAQESNKCPKIESTVVEQHTASASSTPSIFEVLPEEIINLILWYVSEEGNMIPSLPVNKSFYAILQESNYKRIKDYLLSDLPAQDRKGKTDLDLYHLHCARVKSSVVDTGKIPTTLENVYSSPYFESKSSLLSDLMQDIYPINKRVKHFMGAKGNNHALLSHLSLRHPLPEGIGFFIQDKVFQAMQHPVIQELGAQIRKEIEIYFFLILEKIRNQMLFGKKDLQDKAIKAVIMSVIKMIQGEYQIDLSLFVHDILVKPFLKELNNICASFSAEKEGGILDSNLILDVLMNRNDSVAIENKYETQWKEPLVIYIDQPLPPLDQPLPPLDQESFKARYEFIERYAERGIPYFIGLKAVGLAKGDLGYKQSFEEAKHFLENCIQQGSHLAKNIKFNDLSGKKRYGIYDLNPQEARKINEEWIAQGDDQAFHRKIKGLIFGEFKYEPDLSAAFKLIEQEKSRSANHTKLYDKTVKHFEIEFYLYLKNQKKSNPEDLILAQTIEDLGLTEKVQDYAYVHFLIDQLIEQKDEWALKKKIVGYREGKFGYAQTDNNAVYSLIEATADLGHPEAIREKLLGLYLGGHGYTQDFPALASYISSLHSQTKLRSPPYPTNNASQTDTASSTQTDTYLREASYLKALGLKFGLFGFSANPEEARKFILQHRIAF